MPPKWIPIRLGWSFRESLRGGIPLTSHIIGFSKPDHAPHRIYAHCDDHSIWRVLVFGRLGIAYRVAK